MLEVSESLAAGERYLRSSVWRLAAATLLSGVVSGLLAAALGAALVGRPVTALVAQVEKIGGGERSEPMQRHRKDELGRLARAIDRMSHDLHAARETAAREANERLTTLRQLRHAERLATVGRLSSGIAHELGTPLNVLLARSKMIEKTDGVAEDVAAHARIIREQSQRMTRIIRQLLDFARRGDSRKEATDLRALATRTAEVLRPLADKRAVSISLADDGAATATASVDPGQIEQVLTNLLNNAIQASPEGGEVRMVTDAVRAAPPPSHGRAAGPYWRLSVRDSGPGIPPEIRDRIFEPFFTTKDVGEGTGLGLPVAHGIVAEHEGWIEVGESNGAGAELVIHLPREEAAA